MSQSNQNTVTVDGEVQIPQHKWYQFLDALTRVDEELELMIKLQDRTNKLLEALISSLGALPPPQVTPEIQVTAPAPAISTVAPVMNNRYKVFTLDLSIARTNQPLGLIDQGIVANYAVVVQMDSQAYWRRNDPVTGDLEKLSLGYTIENFEIKELYITNDAGSGSLVILIEWRQ
jgi:hypothetical protein